MRLVKRTLTQTSRICVSAVKTWWYTLAVVVFVYEGVIQRFHFGEIIGSTDAVDAGSSQCSKDGPKKIKISWYNVPVFVTYRPDAMYSGFEDCEYTNCVMSYINADAGSSDAVIFTGRLIPDKIPFERPNGQIWILYEHEPPYRWSEINNMWNLSDTYNWTMTYDKTIADIVLPYGEIRKRDTETNVDLNEIMKNKNKTALMIMSHCNTPAERLSFVSQLKETLDLDLLGKCGTEWSCGRRFIHDDCFDLMTNYRFYLAFENSFCSGYFSEKIYENFDYNTVLVSRGGKKGQIKEILPEGTYVSAENFKNARELGRYLTAMSDEQYMEILKRKQQYTSVDSYTSVFKKAMCEVCTRMNNLDKYKSVLHNPEAWAFTDEPCFSPTDIEPF